MSAFTFAHQSPFKHPLPHADSLFSRFSSSSHDTPPAADPFARVDLGRRDFPLEQSCQELPLGKFLPNAATSDPFEHSPLSHSLLDDPMMSLPIFPSSSGVSPHAVMSATHDSLSSSMLLAPAADGSMLRDLGDIDVVADDDLSMFPIAVSPMPLSHAAIPHDVAALSGADATLQAPLPSVESFLRSPSPMPSLASVMSKKLESKSGADFATKPEPVYGSGSEQKFVPMPHDLPQLMPMPKLSDVSEPEFMPQPNGSVSEPKFMPKPNVVAPKRMTTAEREAAANMAMHPTPRAGQLPTHVFGGLLRAKPQAIPPQVSATHLSQLPASSVSKHFAIGKTSPPATLQGQVSKKSDLPSTPSFELPPLMHTGEGDAATDSDAEIVYISKKLPIDPAKQKPLPKGRKMLEQPLPVSVPIALAANRVHSQSRSRVIDHAKQRERVRVRGTRSRQHLACDWPGCSFRSDRKQHLIDHRGTHLSANDPKKRPFGCTICRQRFSQKSHLQRHVKTIHERTARHKCDHPQCGKQFAQKSNLANHLSKVHEDYRLLPYRCPFGEGRSSSHSHCEKRFSKLNYVYGHLRKAHRVANAEVRFPNIVPQLDA